MLVRWESKKAEGALRSGLRIWAPLGARFRAGVRLGLGSVSGIARIDEKVGHILWGTETLCLDHFCMRYMCCYQTLIPHLRKEKLVGHPGKLVGLRVCAP